MITCFDRTDEFALGELQRVRRLMQDIQLLDDPRCLEVTLRKLPTSVSSLRAVLRDGALAAGHRRIILPIYLPGNRFRAVRRINRTCGEIVAYLLGLLSRPDIVIGQTTGTWNTTRACAGRKQNCIRWLDIHGATAEEESLAHGGEAGVDRLVHELNAIEKSAVESADILTCQSEAMIAHLEEKHGRKLPNAFVYQCGVDTDLFVRDERVRTEMRASLGFKPGDLVLVYAGGLQKWQMLPETLRLIARLHAQSRDIKGLVLTRGNHAEVRKMAAAEQLPADCLAVAAAAHQEMPKYLCAADVGVLLREDNVVNRVACPTKLGEYLACGLPLITGEIARHWSWTRSAREVFHALDVCAMDAMIPGVLRYLQQVDRSNDSLGGRCRAVAVDNLSKVRDSRVIRIDVQAAIEELRSRPRKSRKTPVRPPFSTITASKPSDDS